MRLDSRRTLGFLLAVSAWASGETRADYGVSFLVSDLSTINAGTVDPNLKNPWGMSFAPTGPFWVSDQAVNLATLYNGAGTKLGLTVSIPTNATPPTGPNGPTGQVWNGNSADFKLSPTIGGNGNAAVFLFANLNGQIAGWNSGGSALPVITPTAPTIYTGLAIGQVGADNVLYAADARNSKIDVYSSTFANLNGGSFAGKFVDASLAALGYRIFNVQTIGSNVYVTYDSRSNGGNPAISGGAVAVFDLNGNLLRDFSNGAGGPLQDPWGITIAPTSFGQFGGALLVGNKEAGTINAFNATNGTFLGVVATITNDPTSTNNGLWALTFGNGGNGGSTNTLYAFAGINNEVDGLIAAVNAVPEPGSIVLVGIGGALAAIAARRRHPVSA